MDLSGLMTLNIECTGIDTPQDQGFQTWLGEIDFQEECLTPPPPSPPPSPREDIGEEGGGCAIALDGAARNATENAALNLLIIVFLLLTVSRGDRLKGKRE